MTAEDKADLDRLLKDLTIELRDVRNSITANKYVPVLVAKARELELLMKGGIGEVRETEVTLT
jgi:hypothetical protein